MAIIRRWQFGKFQSQHDTVHSASLGFGRSIIVEGSDTNQDQTTYYYDDDNHSVKRDTGDINFIYMAMEWGLALIKAKLGQIPILVSADLNVHQYGAGGNTMTLQVWRFINAPTIDNCSNRYRTRSTVPWYEDVYAPYPTRDIEDPPVSEKTLVMPSDARFTLNVLPVVERALRDNIDVSFMIRSKNLDQGTAQICHEGPTADRWPYLDIVYAYPIEFYEADLAGNLDLNSVVDDEPGHEYYLGAVERGGEGTPVKGFIRNYTGATKQIEIFDDHAETLPPIQREGTGTGQLDYTVLADNAVSQLYTAVFYSSTQYEIQAVAYRDNSISLHPQINGDVTWRGTTGTDFTAPEGGLTIPAAAWQPGTLIDDEIEIGVRGNTTDVTWPADGNDQVVFALDDAGAPDDDTWRQITGRRIRTTAGVTIDATTVLIPTEYVDPADWPVGEKAFIHNAADINHGQVKSIQEADIGTPVFSGSGTDDLTVSGNYNGTITDDYVIEIDAGGTPGTYKASRDGGSTFFVTGVVPTGSPQLLENGIYIQIPTGTAHTLADTWTIPVTAFAVELEALTADSNAYGTGAIVGTTLPFRDVPAAVYSQVDVASGASQTPASRLYLDNTANFSAGDEVLIESNAISDPDSETATVATGGVEPTYLELDAALINDYPVGSFVTKADLGQTAFWMKIDADPQTIEQLKPFRLNARML